MKKDIEFLVPLLGIIILISNSTFHILGVSSLISPGGLTMVMSIYTSFSLLFIYLYFLSQNETNKTIYLSISLVSQVTSLITYIFLGKVTNLFFVSSSLPTSFFIIICCLMLLSTQQSKKSYHQYYGPSLVLICTTFLFGFITDNLFIIGLSDERIGVGLSPYTLLSFFLVATLVSYKSSKLISLNILNIKFNPTNAIVLTITYAILNFLLMFCTGESKIQTALITNFVFISVMYFVIIKPFLNIQKNIVTVCAWSKKVKISEDEWVTNEYFLNSIGIDVTHSINPEEADKIRETKKFD